MSSDQGLHDAPHEPYESDPLFPQTVSTWNRGEMTSTIRMICSRTLSWQRWVGDSPKRVGVRSYGISLVSFFACITRLHFVRPSLAATEGPCVYTQYSTTGKANACFAHNEFSDERRRGTEESLSFRKENAWKRLSRRAHFGEQHPQWWSYAKLMSTPWPSVVVGVRGGGLRISTN
jgi:hypothetical protein